MYVTHARRHTHIYARLSHLTLMLVATESFDESNAVAMTLPIGPGSAARVWESVPGGGSLRVLSQDK
jgi:hypothetical protein